MESRSRRRAWRARPGLTLAELLAAIAVLGTLGALLLPRLAPDGSRGSAAAFQTPVDPGWQGCCDTITLSLRDGRACAVFNRSEYADRGVIGAVLHPQPTEDGYVLIRQLVSGGPAQRAGIQPGDAILKVDGISAQNRSRERVARMITSGRPGTAVRLNLRRSGFPRPLEVKIVREDFMSVFLPGVANW
jgi:membrane-associated protease RseP (regulator of RpoE activity)